MLRASAADDRVCYSVNPATDDNGPARRNNTWGDHDRARSDNNSAWSDNNGTCCDAPGPIYTGSADHGGGLRRRQGDKASNQQQRNQMFHREYPPGFEMK
jgi:hypothetical protein